MKQCNIVFLGIHPSSKTESDENLSHLYRPLTAMITSIWVKNLLLYTKQKIISNHIIIKRTSHCHENRHFFSTLAVAGKYFK